MRYASWIFWLFLLVSILVPILGSRLQPLEGGAVRHLPCKDCGVRHQGPR